MEDHRGNMKKNGHDNNLLGIYQHRQEVIKIQAPAAKIVRRCWYLMQ
jgi:hypothetical protein